MWIAFMRLTDQNARSFTAMSKYGVLAVLLQFSLFPPAYAKDYALNMAICEANSFCKVCIEEIKTNLTVNAPARSVTISGTLITGGSVTEPLPNCSVQSDSDWRCEGVRGVIQARDGKLDYAPTKRHISVDGKNYEICKR